MSLTPKELTWLLEASYCHKIAVEERCRMRVEVVTAWRAHLRRRMRRASIAAGVFFVAVLVSTVVGRFV